MQMDRRVFLTGSVALFGTASAAVPDLRRVAGRKDLLAGSAVSNRELHWPAFTDLLAKEASIVVPENEMKWQAVHPERDRYDFTRGDALVSFAQAHAQLVRGHNLCWHEANPGWLRQSINKQNAARLLEEHIATVAGHYAGKIQAWDVVNEAIDTKDKLPGGLRRSLWYDALGPQYIDTAFRAARKADPHALLTYNDYGLAQDSPAAEAKRTAVLGLLRSMRERKIPIDAFGLQSHLHATGKPEDWSGLHSFLSDIEKLDLQIFITELDVNDAGLPAAIAARDRVVGRLYGDYLHNVLQHGSVKAVLTWGLTDRDSWLRRRRKDGVPERPLPFDPDLKPTRAYFAMRKELSRAPARSRWHPPSVSTR